MLIKIVKIDVQKIKKISLFQEGSHSTADEITKQINDKERVAAALENPSLKSTVDECINHEID